MSVTGFVLAGGKSTRMGRDKALLDWGGRSLLDHMISILSTVANPVHVVGRLPLPDRISGRGPLAGIATALETTQTDANLVVAVDLPLLTPEFLKHLHLKLETSSRLLVACKIGSEFPLCLGIRRGLLSQIDARLAADQLSVHGLIESTHAEIFEWSDTSIFRNINNPQDLIWPSSVPDVK